MSFISQVWHLNISSANGDYLPGRPQRRMVALTHATHGTPIAGAVIGPFGSLKDEEHAAPEDAFSAISVQRQLDVDACALMKLHADLPLEDMINAPPLVVGEALSKHKGVTEQLKYLPRLREPWRSTMKPIKLAQTALTGAAYEPMIKPDSRL
eukprot:jgi/Chlat1/2870/Chrsp195S03024